MFDTIRFIFSLVLNLIIMVLVVLFLPGIPPDMTFEAFNFSPMLHLEPNALLDKAEPILDGMILGPEGIAFKPGTTSDEFYTALADGWVILVKGDTMERVARIGINCEKGKENSEDCTPPVPLGLRFDHNGKLLICTGFMGLIQMDVNTGDWSVLIDNDREYDGKKLGFLNDLDVGSDGSIYFTDSSADWPQKLINLEHISEPSGRLYKFDSKTNMTTLLMDNIHFVNGCQLSKNEDFVMVTSMVRSQIYRVWLTGDKAGQNEIFIDGLPGQPDNIRRNHRGNYYVALKVSREHGKKTFHEVYLPLPLLRKFFLRSITIIQFIISWLRQLIPGDYLDTFENYIITLGPIMFVDKKKTIFPEFDENGTILGSIQNMDANIYSVSQIEVGKEYAFIGSYEAPRIWRIKVSDLN